MKLLVLLTFNLMLQLKESIGYKSCSFIKRLYSASNLEIGKETQVSVKHYSRKNVVLSLSCK